MNGLRPLFSAGFHNKPKENDTDEAGANHASSGEETERLSSASRWDRAEDVRLVQLFVHYVNTGYTVTDRLWHMLSDAKSEDTLYPNRGPAACRGRLLRLIARFFGPNTKAAPAIFDEIVANINVANGDNEVNLNSDTNGDEDGIALLMFMSSTKLDSSNKTLPEPCVGASAAARAADIESAFIDLLDRYSSHKPSFKCGPNKSALKFYEHDGPTHEPVNGRKRKRSRLRANVEGSASPDKTVLWSLDDDKLLLTLIAEYGLNSWTTIASHFTTRSATTTDCLRRYKYLRTRNKLIMDIFGGQANLPLPSSIRLGRVKPVSLPNKSFIGGKNKGLLTSRPFAISAGQDSSQNSPRGNPMSVGHHYPFSGGFQNSNSVPPGGHHMHAYGAPFFSGGMHAPAGYQRSFTPQYYMPPQSRWDFQSQFPQGSSIPIEDVIHQGSHDNEQYMAALHGLPPSVKPLSAPPSSGRESNSNHGLMSRSSATPLHGPPYSPNSFSHRSTGSFPPPDSYSLPPYSMQGFPVIGTQQEHGLEIASGMGQYRNTGNVSPRANYYPMVTQFSDSVSASSNPTPNPMNSSATQAVSLDSVRSSPGLHGQQFNLNHMWNPERDQFIRNSVGMSLFSRSVWFVEFIFVYDLYYSE